ncbi:hypothetical protein [Chromobacterium rhizoryzae]|uniref:hypothetical protein n=1 Tax=Chromobacterium rhizoryzae TaxID=1778675 RepID=UPI001D06E3C5|nr:hypothetical protein [Chromobacterium rhizoryzae]
MQKFMAAATCSFILGGCAAPITYYSKYEDVSKPGKIQFSAQSGAFTSVSLFSDSYECNGIQRLAFFLPGFDETVYVPAGKFITFSVYVQTPGFPEFKYGGGIYTVPFDSKEMRVNVSYKGDVVYTKIDSYDSKVGWHSAKGVIARVPLKPFFDSESWCEPISEIR